MTTLQFAMSSFATATYCSNLITLIAAELLCNINWFTLKLGHVGSIFNDSFVFLVFLENSQMEL